jgi:hypothetical protein
MNIGKNQQNLDWSNHGKFRCKHISLYPSLSISNNKAPTQSVLATPA